MSGKETIMRTMKRVMLILWVSMFSFSVGAAVNNEDRNQLQANDGDVGSRSQTLKKLGQWGSAPFTDIVVNGNYAYCAAGFAGLEILDISDREHPARVAGIETSGPTRNICFNNGFIYVSTNDIYSNRSDAFFEIIDVHDPLNPKIRGKTAIEKGPGSIAVQGDYVYLIIWRGWDTSVLIVFNVSNPELPVQVGLMSKTDRFYEMCVRNNFAYVITRKGFGIIDVSNPAAPFLASSRDIVTYCDGFIYHSLHLKGDYAFILGNYIEDEHHHYYPPIFAIYNIANPSGPYKIWESRDKDYYSLYINNDFVYLEGQKNLDIFDISNIASPVFAKSVDIENWGIDKISGDSKNLFGFIRNGFDIFSLDHPLDPSKIASYDLCGSATGVWASGQKVCLAYGSGGLRMLDVADPLAPKLEWTYKEPYNRPWEYGMFWAMVQENYAYLLFKHEYHNSWRIIDVSNPLHPNLVWTYPFQKDDSGVKRLVVKDRLAYVTIYSNLDKGRLEIYDIRDPSHPLLLANDNTLGDDIYFSGTLDVEGDYIYCFTFDYNVTKIGQLHIFRFSNHHQLIPIGSLQESNYRIRDIKIQYPYVYGVGYDYEEKITKFQIFDVSKPSQPSLLGSYRFGPQNSEDYDYEGYEGSIYIGRQYVYVAGGSGGLLVMDVSDPSNPREVASFHTPYMCDWVYGSGNRIYATDEHAGRMYILEAFGSSSKLIDLSVKRKAERAWTLHPYADIWINVWNEDNIPISSYMISRAEDKGAYAVVKEVSAAEMVANSYQYRDFGLVNQKQYTYKVEALDAQGKVIAVSEEVTI